MLPFNLKIPQQYGRPVSHDPDMAYSASCIGTFQNSGHQPNVKSIQISRNIREDVSTGWKARVQFADTLKWLTYHNIHWHVNKPLVGDNTVLIGYKAAEVETELTRIRKMRRAAESTEKPITGRSASTNIVDDLMKWVPGAASGLHSDKPCVALPCEPASNHWSNLYQQAPKDWRYTDKPTLTFDMHPAPRGAIEFHKPPTLLPTDPTQTGEIMSEFNAVTIHLNDAEMQLAREGSLSKASMADRISEALPPFIELTAGMVYTYEDGGSYQIVRVGSTQCTIRRMTHNSAGTVGSIFVESIEKISNHLLIGRAVICEADDA